ncbi:Vacuolar protein sorting-associated protein 13 [Tilletia horrida]|uniref:Vacuolar protein sorting-associated protein 13 n=1 Tax=Tilletia horrida TaxID=155126 RepID=A0AAN6GBT3_9BASI|nr:Vacuolar protein sorting-associated protein 13 [Tilletia horrida]KAK0537646.1 Vacuolar protein sorting-associated protein 13 [Tilletia horrida]KAK0539944.1 Vacuolar protein sorting-associated protein 13 [Tilletia horrida]KAK0566652.1 Vacuolar protein sorting-associated protein 13 [Tilletia horrida]
MLEGVLASVLNRFLASYVDGLNTSQLNVGIWSGDVKLRNLRLKTSALDKFRLPIDVKEGYLGDLTLSIPWSNLKGKPVRVLIENVYLLAAPKNAAAEYDEKEEEERAQAAKQEKLASAELLGRNDPQAMDMSAADTQKNESFTSSLITKIVDNVQITVRNIHIRYEDTLSNPSHPFSAGITLAEFSAVSTDNNWNPTFVQNTTDGIHKLARLESLSAYWDTDSTSLAGFDITEAQQKFSELIARQNDIPEHQYILKPVTGAGRLIMRRKLTADTPKMDAELLFEELGFALDDEQYRDIILVTDLFQFYNRQAQYRKFRPSTKELEENRPRALLKFAGQAILNEVHEKHRKWSWEYFRERRDDRKEYVALFKKKSVQTAAVNQKQAGVEPAQSDDQSRLRTLERKLDYKDIRFYRSIARHELRKERAAQQKDELQSTSDSGHAQSHNNGGGGWLGWIWGGNHSTGHQSGQSGVLNEEQRKELYDAIEWDENASSAALTQAVDLPRDAMKLRLKTRLQTGSFALRSNEKRADILSLVFDSLQGGVIQRVDNLEAEISLGGLRVYDSTTPNSIYPQLVRIKDHLLDAPQRQSSSTETDIKVMEAEVQAESDPDNPFFYVKFENKPLDDRADNALTLKLRSMEIIYHRGYIESVVQFFKPPESELEVIGALIDVASETIEGIRKETRAGLESALENHKTIDMVLDIQAPIIILPENITSQKCQHIVLDAGHIAVRSVLADQSQMNTIRSKYNQQYTAEDYKQLEELMYDRLFVKLESAQLVMGNDLQSCMRGLTEQSEEHRMHLIERINIDFTVHNSILPKAPNLTKFKITGHLPMLKVNFSDRKYKSLMHMIDVSIPRFTTPDIPTNESLSHGQGNPSAAKPDENGDQVVRPPLSGRRPGLTRDSSQTLAEIRQERRSRIASQLRSEDEYLVDNDDEQDFQDAEDPTADKINVHQKNFELHFVVDRLVGSIFKSDSDVNKPEKLLVDAVFEGFMLHLAIFPFHMDVDVGLRSLELVDRIVEQDAAFKHLITSKSINEAGLKKSSTSGSTMGKDLVRVKYTRVQADSPEFMTVYEGIDQSINVELSTINIMLTRVSVLAVYDWIMTTFVPESPPPTPEQDVSNPTDAQKPVDAQVEKPRQEKLRVRVKLTSIVIRLNNDGQLLATLTLSTADVAVMLRGPTIRVAARLGSLSLLDNVDRKLADPDFRMLLTIQGDELADFTYETFDSNDLQTYPGYDSSIWLRTGSLRFTFTEEPVRELLRFFAKFAQMKAVYDAATTAASAQASQLQQRVTKMHYDVIIKTPIVVLPRNASSTDAITANLGEIYAHNTFPSQDDGHVVTKIEAGLRHIRLASRLHHDDHVHHVQMIDDVNILVDMTHEDHLDHKNSSADADTQILAQMSDVQIKLTQEQYIFVMALTQSIPRAFAWEEEASTVPGQPPPLPSRPSDKKAVEAAKAVGPSGPTVDLLPELGTIAHDDDRELEVFPSLDLHFRVNLINVELFTDAATTQESLHKASLAKFAINGTDVKFKMLSNSAMEADVALKSFTVSDTRPDKDTKFREIIPAVKHDAHQFVLNYTMSAGANASSLALVTVDSPQIIFSLDPAFALMNFVMSAFPPAPPSSSAQSKGSQPPKGPANKSQAKTSSTAPPENAMAFRVNVLDPTIILLEAPERADTQAIVLSIKQILMSQQGVLALKVDQMGMLMRKMNRPKESLRFLDDFDVTMSMDSRMSAARQVTSIEIDIEPLTFRVSYRDIMLITTVVNKAIELSASSNQATQQKSVQKPSGRTTSSASGRERPSRRTSAPMGVDKQIGNAQEQETALNAELIMTKEVLKASVAGLQLILIGDLHSLPIVDMSLQRFAVSVRDWSGDMRMETSMNAYVNYFNLSCSHWEPLIDPWTFSVNMERTVNPPATDFTISSKRRLELNVTTTFIETALTYVTTINDQSIQASSNRNTTPFELRNRTGYRIAVWPEVEDKRQRPPPQYLDDGANIPWRFEDWKSTREHVKESSSNMLSLQIEGMPWERLKHISVDREGEFPISLRPKLNQVPHRLICEVKLKDNVKVISFRSSFQVENQTLVPVELVVLDTQGQLTSTIRKIPPGEICPVPIEAAYHNRIKLRPDPGFDYGWSVESPNWQELTKKSTRVITCPTADKNEAPFRFQCYTDFDKQDSMSRVYPKLTLRLRAPVEIENLLPYDIQYRIFDKNMNHNWSSFLRKGGVSPIHVVQLSHLLLLSVDIQSSVFSPSEFAIIATDNPDDFPVEKVLTMTDAENLKLNLRLHYFRYPDSGGAFKVQIYSPYIFINQTGLPFALKARSWTGSAKLVAGQDSGSGAPERREPMPFLFSHNTNDRRNRVLMRVGNSAWSKPISFEAIGSETEIVIPSNTKNEEIHLGLTVEDGLGKFKLSKVVKLKPRYLVRNNLDEPINLREAGAADIVTAEPDKRIPLHFLRVGASKQMTLAYPGLNNKWTAPFNIEDIGSVHLRIAKAGQHQHLLRAEVLLEGPTIFISISQEKGPWPYMLRNESDHTVTFMQASERKDNGEALDEQVGKRYELKPKSKMKYAWDYPAMQDKLIKLVVNGRERNVNILEIGSLMPFKFPSPDGRGNRVISLDVRADGPTQTLVLSNWSESQSFYKLKRQNSTFSRTDSVMSRDVGFEVADVDTHIMSAFKVDLEGVGISLINRHVQELAYISFRGLELSTAETQTTTSMKVVCKWIQIDNQLFGGLFPIVLYPTVVPKDGKDLEVHPTLQVALIRLKDQSHGVTHVKYASILLQEITAELDEDFLFALYDFSKLKGASWEAVADDNSDFIEHPREIPEPHASIAGQDDIYFEVLHLQPIALNLSFMRTERVNADERVSSRNPLIFFFNALTMALGNVNDAPLRLNALVLENVRLSPAVLQQRIVYHYGQGFLLQLYRVLGSADFLGNPVGLFTNVSSGVADIFYEPYQGLVMHGNKELGLGIARGASSFVKKTVFGVTDSVSKVTGSIGKGLAAATMDKDFQSRRRMSRFRNKPKHALYGITAGANSFFTSVASGFEGLALKPLEGAEQGGAAGFFKGVGKGIVGAITKPAVGVFDLASNVTEGMRNTTVVFDQNDIDRVRLPRFIAADGVVRPYSDREALGQTWLKNVDNGRLMKENYVAHVDVEDAESDAVAMLTTTRVLLIRTLKLKVLLDIPLAELSSISLEAQGIALVLQGNTERPFLKIPDPGTRNFFFKHAANVVRQYNAKF